MIKLYKISENLRMNKRRIKKGVLLGVLIGFLWGPNKNDETFPPLRKRRPPSTHPKFRVCVSPGTDLVVGSMSLPVRFHSVRVRPSTAGP